MCIERLNLKIYSVRSVEEKFLGKKIVDVDVSAREERVVKNVVYREEDGGRRNSAWDDTSCRVVHRSKEKRIRRERERS